LPRPFLPLPVSLPKMSMAASVRYRTQERVRGAARARRGTTCVRNPPPVPSRCCRSPSTNGSKNRRNNKKSVKYPHSLFTDFRSLTPRSHQPGSKAVQPSRSSPRAGGRGGWRDEGRDDARIPHSRCALPACGSRLLSRPLLYEGLQRACMLRVSPRECSGCNNAGACRTKAAHARVSNAGC
jgi:hypothetical protein